MDDDQTCLGISFSARLYFRVSRSGAESRHSYRSGSILSIVVESSRRFRRQFPLMDWIAYEGLFGVLDVVRGRYSQNR
jgi:hypothetical protein